MRIFFLVARPTQFEAPLYRYAAADAEHRLEPLFWDAAATAPVADPELGRTVDWGFDLLAGYPHTIAPRGGGLGWVEERLATGGDLLVVNGYTSALCRDAARRARRRGIPTALRLDSVRFPGEPAPGLLRRRLVRHLLGRWFELFLGTSSLTLEYLTRCGVPAARQGLFPYAVDHDHFRAAAARSRPERPALRAAWGVPPAARVVLAVAKLHVRESPWALLEAVPRLPADVHLVVAGDGPDRPAVQARARQLDAGRIHLVGYAPYARLPAFYAAADAFAHVPREERWGVSVAEALAAGLPVVTGRRVGAGYDLLLAGRNGEVAPADTAADLAAALRRVLELPAATVAAATAEVLPRWGYAASWRGLLDAAARAKAKIARVP